MMLRIILCITLCCTLANAYSKSYMIVFPNAIRPGMPLKLGVTIFRASAPVNVTCIMAKDNAYLASQSGLFEAGEPGTLLLQVPTNATPGTYKIRVDGTGGLAFNNESQLTFKTKTMSILIQTDKPIYKQGQTVRIRALAVYPDLKSFSGPLTVEIYDPSNNKIKSSVDLQESSGVVAAELLLSDQPPLGAWTVRVTAALQTEEKEFTVTEYVEPKFDVTMNIPSYVTFTDTFINGSVVAKYSDGKGVDCSGNAELPLTDFYQLHPLNFVDGKANLFFVLGKIAELAEYEMEYRTVQVKALAAETLTDLSQVVWSEFTFFSSPYAMDILGSTPRVFKPGLTYTGFVKLSLVDGTPIEGEDHKLQVEARVTYALEIPESVKLNFPPSYWEHFIEYKTVEEPVQELSVPNDGIVRFDLEVSQDRATEITFTFTYVSKVRYLTVYGFRSPSDNYLQVLSKTPLIQTGSNAEFEVQSTEQVTTLVYLIMAGGNVVSTNKVSLNSNMTFQVAITPNMAPKSKMATYYVRSDGEVVADVLSFNVKGAFKNQVSVQFDETRAEAGQKVSMVLTADPGSFVGILAVDQSLLPFRYLHDDFTEEKVLTELDTYDTKRETFTARKKRSIMQNIIPIGGTDVYGMFQNFGVIVFTDTMVHRYTNTTAPEAESISVVGSLADIKPMQSYFRETWLWTSVTLGATGTNSLNVIAPGDTSSWTANVFAVHSESGLGVAMAELSTFRRFLLAVYMPDSAVLGEKLILRVAVWNDMGIDLDVDVILEKSDGFKSIVLGTDGKPTTVSEAQTQQASVKDGKGVFVYFPIIPTALGKFDVFIKANSEAGIDGLKKQLLVEAEGVRQEYNQAVVIDLTSTSTYSKTFQIDIPSTSVQSSSYIAATLTDDIMGPTIKNIDGLLNIPLGCAEQNLMHIATPVFLLNYFAETDQFDSEVMEKAIAYLEKGYQNVLVYQHADGSFSSFGESDTSGSMWATAFVTKSLKQAGDHIEIDDEVVTKAINWIIGQQNADGSFPEPGSVVHRAMQTGSSSDVSLTAFVVITLLENKDMSTNDNVRNAAESAVHYLENRTASVSNPYSLAISSYALQKAKSYEAVAAFNRLKTLIPNLLKGASEPEGGYRNTYEMQASAINVEIISYALLAYAEKSDTQGGMPLMKWLISQRNTYGRFSSTLATVVALQALSVFTVDIYAASSPDMQVTIGVEGSSNQVTLRGGNTIILRLPDATKQVTVSATGSGRALFQVSVSYNIKTMEQEPSFAVEATQVEHAFGNLVKVQICSKWLENSPASGMAVLEIGIPSGFEADLESISQLPSLKKTEKAYRKIVLYFDEVSATKTCITFNVQRVTLVAESKQLAVRLYDYFSPEKQVTAFYGLYILQITTVCDICRERCSLCWKD
ncbi:CD109 antigen [Lingula anatina]|uniref:CD109 antigen n=1 Tax=Lingula anatina TaxID=7574 RepID=A0A1S3HD90_LINAN|nr:CD109 antigen [Lingula anatina]|eukprot:XP_013383486.1 CD109 antigen [Lingula anatina]